MIRSSERDQGQYGPPPALSDGDAVQHEGLLWRRRLSVARRYKWLLLTATLGGSFTGFWMNRGAVPTYQATAVLRVTPSPRGAELPGFTQMGDQTDILTQLEMLRSQQTARIVADSLGLIFSAPTQVSDAFSEITIPDDVPPTPLHVTFDVTSYRVTDVNGDLIGQPTYGEPFRIHNARLTVAERPADLDEASFFIQGLEAAGGNLVSRLRTRLRPGTEIVDLTYASTDPVLATRIVNTVARLYQRQNDEQSKRQATARRTFIAAQLARADSEFVAAQTNLERFRRTTGILRSDNELERWHENTMDLETEGVRLRSDRSALQNLLSTVDSGAPTGSDLQALVYAPVVSENDMVTSLYGRYLEIRVERQSLATGRFAEPEQSPNIERLDLLARETAKEIVAAAANLTRVLDSRIAATEERLVQARRQLGRLPDEVSRENELLQQVRASEALVDDLTGELLRARIAEVVEGGVVEIVDLATVPRLPSGTKGPPRVLMGFIAGIIIGIGGAFFLDRLNTTVRDPSDLQYVIPAPNLATVPHVGPMPGVRMRALRSLRGKKRLSSSSQSESRKSALMLNGTSPDTALGESYRALRTNLMFQPHVTQLRCLVVTSAKPSEGKTTTAINLAVVFARQGARTLLIDGDLRHPTMHNIFSTAKEPGLSEAATGSVSLDEAIQETKIEHLFVMTGGAEAAYPSEILGAPRFAEMLISARDRFDMVIVDSPPVLAFTDAAVLGARADGVIVVALSHVTERTAVQMAGDHIHSVGAHILGTVLNGINPSRDSGYGDSYGYYYGYGYSYGYNDKDATTSS